MGKSIDLFGAQTAAVPPLVDPAALYDLQDLAEGLDLSPEQQMKLRLVARRERQKLLDLTEATKADRAQGKERYNSARLFAGMSEGVVRLAALLLGDESILDDPDETL